MDDDAGFSDRNADFLGIYNGSFSSHTQPFDKPVESSPWRAFSHALFRLPPASLSVRLSPLQMQVG
jgi:hypothetical protein